MKISKKANNTNLKKNSNTIFIFVKKCDRCFLLLKIMGVLCKFMSTVSTVKII